MIIFIDSEGDPVQEFSALYVDSKTLNIIDVFHNFVRYPFKIDYDSWARRHIHGLSLEFLAANGLENESVLKTKFSEWLSSHPYTVIYGHAPHKEEVFLNVCVSDVSLLPWRLRRDLPSHRVALSLKKSASPVLSVQCAEAHSSFLSWRPSHRRAYSETDSAKMEFAHHCSFYDCVELYLDFVSKNRKV